MDIRDQDAAAELLEDVRPDMDFHLAAQSLVAASSLTAELPDRSGEK